MKKWMKFIIGVISVIILLLVIDLVCIFTINKPLFAIKQGNGDVYKGLLYDTYICHEYTIPQIKVKGTKFTCSYVNITENKESIYTTTEIENVSVNISNISRTGATIIIKDIFVPVSL